MPAFTSTASTTAPSQSGIKAFVGRHKLITFFTLAIAYTWIAVVLLNR